jgi:formylmethanofuran dehydrogenase subunit C
MPQTLRIRTQSSIPIEVDALLLSGVRNMTAGELSRVPIHFGNQSLPAGELFEISGSAVDDNTQVWQGDCSAVKYIGRDLAGGMIIVEGHAGMHLGAEMLSGRIVCHGNASDWVGAEMKGGEITVHGNAGDLAGAAYRGARRGMTGGKILIHGNAGNEAGHSMRRGMIAIGGSCGVAPGFAMIAGSMLIFGSGGLRPGAGMKRGSIVFFRREQLPDLLPTWRFSGRWAPEYLPPIMKSLRRSGFPVGSVDSPDSESFGMSDLLFNRFAGDFLEQGKGEILLRDGNPLSDAG